MGIWKLKRDIRCLRIGGLPSCEVQVTVQSGVTVPTGTKLSPYLYTLKTTINQQKEHSEMFRLKLVAKKNDFLFRENSHVTKFLKKHFPKGMFQ